MSEAGEPDIVKACRALYAAIDRLDHAAAQRVGVSRSELRCLNLLEHGPVRPLDLARGLELTTGSMTTMLDRLERKGLVTRGPSPTDRRSIQISATPEVFRQLGPLYRAVALTLAETVQGYDETERVLAVKHLRDVTRACEAALDGQF